MPAGSDLIKIVNRIMGSKSFLSGGTDGTTVGNTSDKLKVDATISGITGGVSSAFSSKLRIEPQVNGITLAANVYTVVYTYTGSGLIIGFNLEFNNTNIIVRLKVDGETIMDTTTLATLNGLLATSNNAARYQAGHGIVTNSSTIDFSFRSPIKFTSSIEIAANANSGLFTRNFNQGIVYIQKDT